MSIKKRRESYLSVLVIILMVFYSFIPDVRISVVAAEPSAEEMVPEWAVYEIQELRKLGIINGYPDGSFKPNRTIARAEWTAMLNRLARSVVDLQRIEDTYHFTDVKDQWFAEEVKAAASYGLIEGYPDGTFRAEELITRNQAAVMLGRMLHATSHGNHSSTIGEDIPAWAAPAVAALAEANILVGNADGTFDGSRALTRAEAAVLLYRTREALQAEGRLTHAVSVRFNDSSGLGISDARIFVHEKGKRSHIQTGVTDASGSIVLSLLPGEYELRALQDERLAHRPFVVTDRSQELLLEAESAAVIAGKIVRGNGTAVTDVILALTNNPTWYAMTDATGEFEAYVLPEQSYQLAILENARFHDLDEETIYTYQENGLAALTYLDASSEELAACDCNLYEEEPTFTAPAAGNRMDIGTIWVDGAPSSSSTGGTNAQPQPDPGPDPKPDPKPTPDPGDPNTDPDPKPEPEPDPDPDPDPDEDTTAPIAPTGLIANAGDRSVALLWTANSELDLAGYKVYVSTDGGQTWQPGLDVGNVTSRTFTGLENGNTYTFAITAYDSSDNESVKSVTVIGTPIVSDDDQLPPDPIAVASSLPLTGSAAFKDTTAFLYSGSNPIQSDVTEGAIHPDRAATCRYMVHSHSL